MSKYVIIENYTTAKVADTKREAMEIVSAYSGELTPNSKERARTFLEVDKPLTEYLVFYSATSFEDSQIFEVN